MRTLYLPETAFSPNTDANEVSYLTIKHSVKQPQHFSNYFLCVCIQIIYIYIFKCVCIYMHKCMYFKIYSLEYLVTDQWGYRARHILNQITPKTRFYLNLCVSKNRVNRRDEIGRREEKEKSLYRVWFLYLYSKKIWLKYCL